MNSNTVDKRTQAEKDEEKVQSEKAEEYVRELMKEKHDLDVQKAPNAARLIEQGKFFSYFSLTEVPISN